MEPQLQLPPAIAPPAPPAAPRRVERGVTFRAVLIGLFLIPINAYWVMRVEGIWHTNHATAMSLFWNSVFCIFLLVLLNLVLKAVYARSLRSEGACPLLLRPACALGRRVWNPRPRSVLVRPFVQMGRAALFPFNQGELIVVFVMVNLVTALVGHDTLQLGIPGLSFPFWFASSSNHWDLLFNHYYPKWATVQDKDKLAEFYYGSSTLYTVEHLRMWIGPVLVWCSFIGAMGLVMICMNVILRKQWTENEKLSFPIVQLPLALTAGGGTVEFFRNQPLWYGFLIGAGIDLLNGLNFYYPAIPGMIVRHDVPERDLGQFITQFPWNQIPRLWLPLYPFIVALGYFLPLDLSFSIWFFYLLRLGMIVASAALGYQPNSPRNPPYLNEQSYGAWFAIFLYAMYVGRGHFVQVFRKACGLSSTLDDSTEALTYRQALIGMLIGMAFLVGFCLMAGMTLGVVLIFFGIFFFIAIALTRVRAELGPPAHEIVGMNAGNLMVMFGGTNAIGPANLTMFTMFYWFTGRGYRSNPMPCQLEAMKMADAGHVNMRGMGWVMMLAMVVGGLASYWAAIHQEYQVGAATDKMTGHNWGQYNQLQSRLMNPVPPDHAGMWASLFGLVAAFAMIQARIHWMWWPFHPAGYALSLNFGVDYFWSCLLLSSLIKWSVIRYGGYRLNRQVMPFMFGLILGEYIVGAFWSALSVITGFRTYDFAPG